MNVTFVDDVVGPGTDPSTDNDLEVVPTSCNDGSVETDKERVTDTPSNVVPQNRPQGQYLLRQSTKKPERFGATARVELPLRGFNRLTSTLYTIIGNITNMIAILLCCI